MFGLNKPRKIIKTIPQGPYSKKLSEEDVIKEIYRDIYLGFLYEKDKTGEVKKVSSSIVYNSMLNCKNQLLEVFKVKFPNETIEMQDVISELFDYGIYFGSEIYNRDKFLRVESITIPTGKEFEDYYRKELAKFDKSNEYADLLIPKYLFNVVKQIAIKLVSDAEKVEVFAKTSANFKETLLIQYIHLITFCLASHLIQDFYA